MAREIQEELNLEAGVGPLLDAWVFEVLPGSRVLILAYGCFVDGFDGMARSAEHSEVGLFGRGDLSGIASPEGYARAVRAWAVHPAVFGASRL